MSVCNRAQFEHVRRSMRRVSTMRALQKSASEAMLSGPVKKKFTIVCVDFRSSPPPCYEYDPMFSDTRTGQVSERRCPALPSADLASCLPTLEQGIVSEETVPSSTREYCKLCPVLGHDEHQLQIQSLVGRRPARTTSSASRATWRWSSTSS